MQKQSKYLFFAVAVLVAISVIQTYWKMMVIKDFAMVDDVGEDPAVVEGAVLETESDTQVVENNGDMREL